MIFACSGHDQVGQGRPDTVVTPKGRAAQGRAGQGRAGPDMVCISTPQTMPETRQGQRNADRLRKEHAHVSTSPHTPIAFHC